MIRLKDGETNFLAGLIRTDESNDRPAASRASPRSRSSAACSRNKRNEAQRTDVILTLTPHIIRIAEITEEDLAPIWVGTEQNITFRGGSPRVESEVEGPFDDTEGTPEEIQDAIRRRVAAAAARPASGRERRGAGGGRVPSRPRSRRRAG